MVDNATRRWLLFAGAAAGIFVFGIVMAVLGTLFGLPEMRARLQITLAQQGTMFLLLYLGIFMATLIAGPVIDAIGTKLILIVSTLLVAASMAGFAFADSFGTAAVPAVLLGCGGGGLNIATNALVSDLYGENRGPMLNVLGIFYGIGALCIPLVAGWITGRLPIAPQMFFCAGLAIACGLVFLAMRFPAPTSAQSFSWREAFQVARYPGVLVLAFLLFCQSGNEACIAGWTSTYMGQTGFSAKAATFILAGYWAALMIGRMIVAQLLRFVRKEQLVLASGLGAVVGAAILLANRSQATLLAGVLIIGLSYAGVFPTTLAIAGDNYRKLAGSVFGLLIAIALIGGMSFPWAEGQISQVFGIRMGVLVPLVGAVVICVLASRILLVRTRETVLQQVKT